VKIGNGKYGRSGMDSFATPRALVKNLNRGKVEKMKVLQRFLMGSGVVLLIDCGAGCAGQ
jgi:hypothetical protein